MNHELQYKFEKELAGHNIVKSRKLFNKDSKGVYEYPEVFFMYRVWVMKEAEIERLKTNHKRELEENFMLGYTDAEYDYWRSSNG